MKNDIFVLKTRKFFRTNSLDDKRLTIMKRSNTKINDENIVFKLK